MRHLKVEKVDWACFVIILFTKKKTTIDRLSIKWVIKKIASLRFFCLPEQHDRLHLVSPKAASNQRHLLRYAQSLLLYRMIHYYRLRKSEKVFHNTFFISQGSGYSVILTKANCCSSVVTVAFKTLLSFILRLFRKSYLLRFSRCFHW